MAADTAPVVLNKWAPPAQLGAATRQTDPLAALCRIARRLIAVQDANALTVNEADIMDLI